MDPETPPDPLVALARVSSFADVEAALAGQKVALQLRHDTPEMDLFVVLGELSRGEKPRHALEHLAALLSFDPFRDGWLALVDEAEAKWGDLSPHLAPEPGKQRYFATEALRAYLAIGRGELEEAALLLASVGRARPDVRYLDAWLLPILEGEGIERLSDGALTQVLVALVEGCPEHAVLPARRAEAMETWAEIAVALSARARSPSPQLLMMAAGVCRRAGQTAAGLALLDRAPRSWATETARALLLRHAGRLDEAVAAFVRAGELDPSDLSWMLEAGDALFDAERWTEAERMYDRVLERQPQHPWAEPSKLACASRAAGEPTSTELLQLAHEGNGRARSLASDRAAWIGAIPWPTDATTNAIFALLREGVSRATLALSGVEAPSNHTLARHALGEATQLDVSYTGIATPDPREPIAPVEIALWRREGEVLVPALPPPPAELAQRITTLARTRFRRATWWAAAGRDALALTPDDLPALLACIARPPLGPKDVRPHEWIVRVQLASAMVMAQLEPDEPWTESARRRGLFALLHGPMDWSTSAAIVALACLVEDEHAIATEVHRGFAQLLLARPDAGAVCWEETLLSEWRWVRGLYPRERELLSARLDAFYRRS